MLRRRRATISNASVCQFCMEYQRLLICCFCQLEKADDDDGILEAALRARGGAGEAARAMESLLATVSARRRVLHQRRSKTSSLYAAVEGARRHGPSRISSCPVIGARCDYRCADTLRGSYCLPKAAADERPLRCLVEYKQASPAQKWHIARGTPHRRPFSSALPCLSVFGAMMMRR